MRSAGPSDGGDGWGSLDYEDLMAVVDTALSSSSTSSIPNASACIGRLVRRLHDVLDRQPHGPLQGRAALSAPSTTCSPSSARPTSAGSTKAYTGVWPVRGRRAVPRPVADDVRGQDHDAAADPPLGERPPLQRRAGRAPVHDPSLARPRGGVRPLPGREPRAVARRLAVPPRHAPRDPARLVRALPAVAQGRVASAPPTTKGASMPKWWR